MALASSGSRRWIERAAWLAAFACLGIAALCFWLSTVLTTTNADLAAAGVEAAATVLETDTEARSGSHRASGRPEIGPVYSVSFTFADETGAHHLVRKDVSFRFYGSVRAGDTIAVRYLPDNPQVNEIEPGAVSRSSFALMAVAIAFGAIGSIWIVALGVKAYQGKRPALSLGVR